MWADFLSSFAYFLVANDGCEKLNVHSINQGLFVIQIAFPFLVLLIKSFPGNRGTYCFWSVFAAAAVLPTLFNFAGKPLKLISSNHTWLTYGCGQIFRHLIRWPWIKVTKLPKRDPIYFVPTIKWEPLIQSIHNWTDIPPLVMLSTWLNFRGMLLESFLSNFRKISNPFISSRTFYLPYLRNGLSNCCETKRK